MSERWNRISSTGKIEFGDKTIQMHNFLEMVHGANEWHTRAQWVYCQSIGMDFREFKEAMRMGRQFREQGGQPIGYLSQHCLGLLDGYEQAVSELGSGNVKDYVQAMGENRNSVDQAVNKYLQEN